MKRKLLLFLCVCMIAVMPISVNGETWVADAYNEDGTPIFYIDMAPEEWEETYLNHPFFQNYKPGMKATFRFEDNVRTRAICYNCGRSSMSLQQEWNTGVAFSIVTCPGGGGSSDERFANAWRYRDYCNSCGPLTGWNYNKDSRTWDWHLTCNNSPRTYEINVGASIEDGWDFHNCFSIKRNDTSGPVHGFNCNCANGDHYAGSFDQYYVDHVLQ